MLMQAMLNNMSHMARFTSIYAPNPQGVKVEPEELARQYSQLTSKVVQSGETLQIIGLDGHKKTISKKDFDQLPNHLKAMFSSGFTFGDAFSAIFDDSNAGDNSRYNLILGSLAEVEVLSGYNKDID